MKKAFVRLLALLFMLQSVWGVAEASCLHEMRLFSVDIVVENSSLMPSLEKNLILSTVEKKSALTNLDISKIKDYCQKICVQDQCSHFGQHISLNPQQSSLQHVTYTSVKIRQRYYWQNFYQSPDLIGQNPPPLLSPL
ncbi:hypothetical protein F4V57_00145 [Acinetobacter qingfengensis]|uniref:Uncharacterized protein n=1 Tax=Acinetobacter qingfengensis TaxID=1262585 RepID=A0A1E7RCF4_9GAMM|nr:hypothetical protein [Acinetobacter qingfengensis]KAA8735251.1 hypothetical protein F4V57_00145 [Acinetobacter qingfengensis]OEY96973.1 hypothetical protein BJI46_11440 [Acinetobacter qingfengensis]